MPDPRSCKLVRVFFDSVRSLVGQWPDRLLILPASARAWLVSHRPQPSQFSANTQAFHQLQQVALLRCWLTFRLVPTADRQGCVLTSWRSCRSDHRPRAPAFATTLSHTDQRHHLSLRLWIQSLPSFNQFVQIVITAGSQHQWDRPWDRHRNTLVFLPCMLRLCEPYRGYRCDWLHASRIAFYRVSPFSASSLMPPDEAC